MVAEVFFNLKIVLLTGCLVANAITNNIYKRIEDPV